MAELRGDHQPMMQDDEIDLIDLFSRIWAGKFLILLVVLLAGAIGVLVAMNTPPVYRADGLLQLEEKTNQLALPQALAELSAESPRAVTEIEIIRSRLVVGRAVSRLNLDWSASPAYAPVFGHLLSTREIPYSDFGFLTPYARPGDAITLDLLDVPPAWLGEDILVIADGVGGFVLDLPNGQRLEGEVGETVIDEALDFSVRIGELNGAAGRLFVLQQLGEVAAIARVRDSLSVSEQGRSSGILQMTYEDHTPEDARRILDAIAQAYLAQNADRSAAEAESSLVFVQSQLPEARAALDAAEAALDQFRREQEAIDLSAEGVALLTQIRALETEQLDLQALEQEIAERYTPNHPEYQRLIASQDRVAAQLASLREEVRTLPAAQREILNLSQDLELAREVFVQLRNRAQELEVLRASNIGNVRIVDTARASDIPVAPRSSRIVALALLLGGVLAVGLVLLRGYLRRGISGAEEIEATGLPVFGTLNRLPFSSAAGNGKKRRPLIALERPDDLFVEGLRSLRTSLHFAMLDADSKSIGVTSPAPEAGKSTVCANLAVVAANAGQKVCLIDADLRRGSLRKFFGIPRTQPGLAQVLSNEATLDAALTRASVDGLSVLPSGKFPPNPSELLMRKEMGALITRLGAEFDLIIIDTPPVLAVTDPSIIGRLAGATIAVARFQETTPTELQALRKSLESAGVKLSGVVLNAFDPRKARKNSRYAYAYNYRYSYTSRS